MNDDIREQLSAYLDGALPETERLLLEAELARSAELRGELEALRAVSGAVKSLPKETLPPGFMARLDARRARETKPERDYFILPPAYRPLAFALSTGVVALVIWDKTQVRPDIMAPRVGWDHEIVEIKRAADAPPSIDVSGTLSAMGAGGEGSAAKPEPASADKITANPTFGKHLSAPGKPIEQFRPDGALTAEQAEALDNLPSQDEANNPHIARNEEERSAINERLYKGLEEEKRRMGIARIVEKDSESDELASGGRELMTLQAAPAAPRLARGVGAVRGAQALYKNTGATAEGPSPVFRALALKSVEALQAAWAAAGLAGEPPRVNFPEEMAIFLAGPAGSGIVEVRNRRNTLLVLYKSAGFDDASARVKAVALTSKPLIAKPAP